MQRARTSVFQLHVDLHGLIQLRELCLGEAPGQVCLADRRAPHHADNVGIRVT